MRYVLEGSVRKVGNRVRVTAQLIDGENGNHIWAERYDRELEDIFAVQDEISETVIGAIEPELSRAEQQRAARKPPESMDAWDLYQRGLWHMWRFSSNDRAESQRYFNRAIEIDPNFASTYAALAYTHAVIFINGESDTPIEELNAAFEVARKAIAIDEQDAIAHWALGIVYFFRRDFASSIDALRNSIEINPGFAQAHFTMGMVLANTGRPREGLTHLDEAGRLSPRDPLSWVGMVARLYAHYFLEDYEQAAAWGLKAVRDPKSVFWAHALYAATLARLGRADEVEAAVAELLKVSPQFSLAFAARTAPLDEIRLALALDGFREAGIPE